jgi:hypothetical protein
VKGHGAQAGNADWTYDMDAEGVRYPVGGKDGQEEVKRMGRVARQVRN